MNGTRARLRLNGTKVRRRLLELDMSKERFAAASDFSMSTVANILASRRIDERNAFRAADVLGLPLESLIAEEVASATG